MATEPNTVDPGHVGEVIRLDFLEPGGVKPAELAKAAGVNRGVLSGILSGKRRLSAEVGVRIAEAFGMSPGYFLKVQAGLDRIRAQQKIRASGSTAITRIELAA